MIIDTHAHYDDEAFNEDRDELLNSLKSNNIEKVINIGANMKGSENTVLLTKQYDFIYGAVGVHPDEIAEVNEETIERLRILSREEKILAIGEIGLDYYHDEFDRKAQEIAFRAQLNLAREEGLPVVIHSREAAKDTLDILVDEKIQEIGGVMHCYSYSKEMAEILAKYDMYFGIGGVITFKNAKKLKESLEVMPLDRILLETDCPYLAPTPYRGKRNSSLYLPYVVETISEIKGISVSDVENVTTENAIRLFGFTK